LSDKITSIVIIGKGNIDFENEKLLQNVEFWTKSVGICEMHKVKNSGECDEEE